MFSVEITTFSWDVHAGDLCEINSSLNWMNSLVTLKASLCPIYSAYLKWYFMRGLDLSIMFSCSPLSQKQHFAPCFFYSPFLFPVSPSPPPASLYHFSGLWEKSAMDVLVWLWLCAVMDASRSRVLSWILKRQMGVETEWDGNAMQL